MKKIIWYPPEFYPEHNRPKSTECLGNQDFDPSLYIQLDQQELSIPHQLKYLNELVGANGTPPTWIYWREFGVFFIAGNGSHPCAMAMLHDYKHREPRATGDDDMEYTFDWFTCGDPSEDADKFLLETPGTAYLSSLSSTVKAGRPEFLTTYEKRMFGDNIRYLNS
jgi:hypothetical protein